LHQHFASASAGNDSRRSKGEKPRLGTLSKQLHLPIDKVEIETRRFLEHAGREEESKR
jgi:hypothetical protein